jgi:DNA polymerase I-like protein with 3'-5' exonuclease and polymerase domains
MDLITLDYETYYDKDYGLRKMTTEAYIRDPRFEVIGLSVKVNGEPTEWASGTFKQTKEYLNDSFDWKHSMLLAHNTAFDGAISHWHFGISARAYTDTMCIARSLHGVDVSVSLAALAERYGLAAKGTAVQTALGKRRADFTEEELEDYGDYCINDTNICYNLFLQMTKHYPKKELQVIDNTLRMYIEPILELDPLMLEMHLNDVVAKKQALIDSISLTKKELMSSNRFAEELRTLGVVPPMKVSPATGLDTFAFAKTDEAFIALQDHPQLAVQALVSARLGSKSTLEESRTQRFIDIAKRGNFPVPIKYYAAHTGRWGGWDKINIQNLPSRGDNGKVLKKTIMAPEGYILIDSDSSQIEARVLAWFAGQDDLVTAFANGDPVYEMMAAAIYEILLEVVSKDQRFVGKTTILGAGYGMGAVAFQAQLANFGMEVSLEECRRIIAVYRDKNDAIKKIWKRAQLLLRALYNGESFELGKAGVLKVVSNYYVTGEGFCPAIILPSGLPLRYPDLEFETGKYGLEYTYRKRNGRTRVYGGKVIENICQALARGIIADQMSEISKRYKVALSVHDSVVACVRIEEQEEAKAFMEACMRKTPAWAEGLPLDCESGTAVRYGDC